MKIVNEVVAEPSLSVDAGCFRRMVGAVIHAVSRDETRAHLCSIHIVATKDSLVIEGTDGACAARWTAEGEFDAIDVLVPRARMTTFLAALPKMTKQVEMFDDGVITVTGKSLSGQGASIEYSMPEVLFPSIDKVLPDRDRPSSVSTFAVAGAYLALAAKVSDSAGALGPMISTGSNPLDPILFTFEAAPTLTLIVMPLRPDEVTKADAADDKPVADSGMAGS